MEKKEQRYFMKKKMKNKYIFFNYLLRGLQIVSYILTIILCFYYKSNLESYVLNNPLGILFWIMVSPVIIFGLIVLFNLINIIEEDFTEFAINTILIIPVLANIFHMKLLNFDLIHILKEINKI